MKFGFISGLTWGINAVVISMVWVMMPFVDAPGSAVAIPFVHDLICALLLLVFMVARKRTHETFKALKIRAGWGVAGAAVLGGPVAMTGYVFAIGSIGPAYTTIVTAFYPAVGAFLAYVFLKERMKAGQITALLVALLGVAVMGWAATDGGENKLALLGVFAALLSVVGWGAEAVILAWAMRHDNVDNETALQIRQTTSAVVYGVIVVPLFGALPLAFSALPTPATGVIAIAAVAGTVSYLAYYRAIATIGASRSMALNISYPAWSVVFGLILLGQVPTMTQVLCCLIVLVGTTLAATPEWRSLLEWKGRPTRPKAPGTDKTAGVAVAKADDFEHDTHQSD